MRNIVAGAKMQNRPDKYSKIKERILRPTTGLYIGFATLLVSPGCGSNGGTVYPYNYGNYGYGGSFGPNCCFIELFGRGHPENEIHPGFNGRFPEHAPQSRVLPPAAAIRPSGRPQQAPAHANRR